MTQSRPTRWIAILASLPGACAAALPPSGGSGLLLTAGILGLGSLTLLSERWGGRE